MAAPAPAPEDDAPAVETVAALRAGAQQLLALIDQEGAERVLLETRTRELAEQLESLRAELDRSEVARDAAAGEAAGLRAEIDRLGAELADAHAHARRPERAGAGLLEARSLLVEAKAATARLRERSERVPDV